MPSVWLFGLSFKTVTIQRGATSWLAGVHLWGQRRGRERKKGLGLSFIPFQLCPRPGLQISRGNETVGEVVCLGKQKLALSLPQGVVDCGVNTYRCDPITLIQSTGFLL